MHKLRPCLLPSATQHCRGCQLPLESRPALIPQLLWEHRQQGPCAVIDPAEEQSAIQLARHLAAPAGEMVNPISELLSAEPLAAARSCMVLLAGWAGSDCPTFSTSSTLGCCRESSDCCPTGLGWILCSLELFDLKIERRREHEDGLQVIYLSRNWEVTRFCPIRNITVEKLPTRCHWYFTEIRLEGPFLVGAEGGDVQRSGSSEKKASQAEVAFMYLA
ncbi:hypothetical protein Anapl_01443 [Anas platyrhynchos]|uniref:Uncharacterized protein n=1 Tax=Anas platyrhynchos TaxID=8839 RepID=R0LRZ4_ANAPL|nr:hypothetical protein Anapl_01443 [Anas platyrhynchos]